MLCFGSTAISQAIPQTLRYRINLRSCTRWLPGRYDSPFWYLERIKWQKNRRQRQVFAKTIWRKRPSCEPTILSSLWLKISHPAVWTSLIFQSELITVYQLTDIIWWLQGADRMPSLVIKSAIFYPVSNILLSSSWALLPKKWITKQSQNSWKSLINFNYWRGWQIILCTSVISADTP